MPSTDFMILAETRSSSTNLIRWLAQLPQSLIFAETKEIIHPKWCGLSIPFARRLAPGYPKLEAWRLQRLQEFYAPTELEYLLRGSKITVEMSFPGLKRFLQDSAVKIIALSRKDYIGQTISMYYSERARVWHRFDEQLQLPIIRYCSPDSLLLDAVAHLKNQKSLLNSITEGLDCLVLDYEDALQTEGKNKILEFLGVLNTTIEASNIELPLAPCGYRFLIENYEELLGDIAALWIEVQADERSRYY